MGNFVRLLSLLAAVGSHVQTAWAQTATPVTYTDSDTGIVFNTWPVPDSRTKGGMTWGMALPENGLTTDADEFIGILTCSSTSATQTGWCGMSLGGPMTNNLLLMAWPYEDEVYTSFLWATGYALPVQYTGDAKLTQISSTVNSTHYQVIFRCQNCLSWNQGGNTGGASTSNGLLVLGWAQALAAPMNAQCPAEVRSAQHEAQGIWGASLNSDAANPSYSQWAALATKTVTGCGGSAPPTTTSSSTTASSTAGPTGIPVPTASYDYVIVGAGAGGIPLADKLSESGKSVLLIEKGPPSSGHWGGKRRPEWLESTDLTRFDVPGLCNEIWVDSDGIACTDTDQMAGCVLGGGTAVNAGLWWKPYTLDWDYNFPNGWKSADMAGATSRVFSRIPGTDTPSMDGKRYLQQGFNVLAGGLKSNGWKEVAANAAPNQKNRTYGHSAFMFSGGERGGPMATYLQTASKRSNFKLWMNTAVKRVVRQGGHVTGIEVEPFLAGGYSGTVKLTPVTGRVILSAGTFGSAKALLRSGIGPKDQLDVVKSSTDGPTMIKSEEWINLPVGYNLDDHTNTDTVVTHPNVVFYDFYEAYDTPNATDKSLYLDKRSGILAQAAPNIGPLMWDEIKGSDGITRQLQWTSRVEGSAGVENGYAMTMSQYLGRGAKSRGRMTITPGLSTVVSTVPYLREKADVEAVIQGIKNMQAALKGVEGLEWVVPDPATSVEDFVNNMVVSYSNRRANHWIGTSKMGTDDGRKGGTAVVDTNTKVYGTDNLFVVDASIFPGHVTTNPSSYIVIAAEKAAEKILALAPVKANARYSQCGGRDWTGSYVCATGTTCQFQNEYYSQCL